MLSRTLLIKIWTRTSKLLALSDFYNFSVTQHHLKTDCNGVLSPGYKVFKSTWLMP